MFEFFRKHTRLFQFLLLILIVPAFVLTGVYQGYNAFNDSSTGVAKVAGEKVTQAEWDNVHRQQVERMRSQMPNVDIKLFDSAEMKRQSLDLLIRERVMLAAADKLKLTTTDDRLQRLFATDPRLAFLRNPDGSVNRDALAAQGMTPAVFEQRLRQDLSQRQVLQGVEGTAFAPAADAAMAVDAMFQQREIQVQRFNAADQAAKVAPTDAEIEAYYKNPANAAQFQSPEQARIEYVVLDLDALKKGISVPEEDLRKYYTENQVRYTTPEERRASHILVKADKSASAADRAKAKAKAEALLAELKKSPAAFADLARKNSDDPGSAEKGGDLDFFARGAMTKPFEDAAFGLKQGETSGVVESDYGYHIIKLTDVRGGNVRSFDAVRGELENEVKTQLAHKRFSEVAVEFTNMVYEQPDSLQPVVDKFKLELRTAANVQRTPLPGAVGPLASTKFLEALFGNDALRNKRNTEAVETGASQMVSGRVVQYLPARQLPLVDVQAPIRVKLVASQSIALARKLGEARLAELRAAPDTAMTEPSQVVSRVQARDMPRELMDAALKAPVASLPAFVGVQLGDTAYAVVKIGKVLGRDPVVADAKQAQAQYAQTWGNAEAQAYYDALKARFKVEIKPQATASVADAASSGLK